MKKNHPPGGTRVASRVLIYSIAFISMLGMRETLSSESGPVSDTLGKKFNQVLMTGSKMGLGMALLSSDRIGENTMLGRYSRKLGMASHQGYVSSAKVELYSR
jgi:hypothetical protein